MDILVVFAQPRSGSSQDWCEAQGMGASSCDVSLEAGRVGGFPFFPFFLFHNGVREKEDLAAPASTTRSSCGRTTLRVWKSPTPGEAE